MDGVLAARRDSRGPRAAYSAAQAGIVARILRGHAAAFLEARSLGHLPLLDDGIEHLEDRMSFSRRPGQRHDRRQEQPVLLGGRIPQDAGAVSDPNSKSPGVEVVRIHRRGSFADFELTPSESARTRPTKLDLDSNSRIRSTASMSFSGRASPTTLFIVPLTALIRIDSFQLESGVS